jgi:hypothetical protein
MSFSVILKLLGFNCLTQKKKKWGWDLKYNIMRKNGGRLII